MKTMIQTFTLAAMTIGSLTVSAHAQTHSFNMGTASVSGDVPALNNPDGLQFTGTVGAWSNIWIGSATPTATNNGVTLTLDGTAGGGSAVFNGTVGDSRGNGVGSQAIRTANFWSTADITWTLTGLTSYAFYDMVWYNKRNSPGENRAPNTGVSGFDAGNGVGASAPYDGGRDQNFVGVQADGTGTISGTWFINGAPDTITAVAGVQVKFVSGGGGDVTPPAVSSLSPANGAANVATNSNLVATFSEDIQKGSSGDIRIRVVGGGAPVQTIPVSSGDVTVSGKVLTIDPSDFLDSTGYYVEIDSGAIEDLAGNDFPGISGETTWSFTTKSDFTAPSIATLAPSNGEADVAVYVPLVATFDENVAKGSTGDIRIWVVGGGSPAQTIPVTSGDVTVSGAVVTITHTGDLAYSTAYYVEIDSGAIKDLAGNDFTGIAGDSTWSFTTAAPRLMSDVVASFNLGGGSVSGDVPAANNPNGLLMTGTVGAWPTITTTTPSATNNGVTLTFTATSANWGITVGDSRGNGVGSSAQRIGTFVTTPVDVPWTITGLTPGAFYDMVWYNKRESPGETRHPNSGVAGFDAGNGVGASGPLDADRDQDFIAVQADGSGTISGTWFLAGGAQDITAVAGVQIGLTIDPPIATITSFEGAGATGVIDQSARTIALEVPFGTNLATLAPTFTLSSGTCDQTSGQPPSPNFATQNPVEYVVTDTSTDPDTVNTYAVTVTVGPKIATLVIDLGTSPAGTTIGGGTFIGSGPTNLPLPALPGGSILQSIAVDVVLEATDNGNYASDLSLLFDPTPGTPGGDFSVEITNGTAPLGGAALNLDWPASADAGVGTNLVDTKTEADWAAAGPIDLASIGLFLGNAFGTAPAGGTWSGTITLTYVVGSGGNNFSDWIAGFSVGGQTGIGDDPDGDGVDSGAENFFGTPPDTFTGGLSSGTVSGNTFTFTHPQGTLAGDLTAGYRWSTDLQDFHADGASDGGGTKVDFSVQLGTPEAGTTTVTATISGSVIPAKLFVDVEVTQN